MPNDEKTDDRSPEEKKQDAIDALRAIAEDASRSDADRAGARRALKALGVEVDEAEARAFGRAFGEYMHPEQGLEAQRRALGGR